MHSRLQCMSVAERRLSILGNQWHRTFFSHSHRPKPDCRLLPGWFNDVQVAVHYSRITKRFRTVCTWSFGTINLLQTMQPTKIAVSLCANMPNSKWQQLPGKQAYPTHCRACVAVLTLYKMLRMTTPAGVQTLLASLSIIRCQLSWLWGGIQIRCVLSDYTTQRSIALLHVVAIMKLIVNIGLAVFVFCVLCLEGIFWFWKNPDKIHLRGKKHICNAGQQSRQSLWRAVPNGIPGGHVWLFVRHQPW